MNWIVSLFLFCFMLFGNRPLSLAQNSYDQNADRWYLLYTSWTDTVTGPVNIEERRGATASPGNDSANDDISFLRGSTPDPCFASFNIEMLVDCNEVAFINQSDGILPLTYNWNFSDPGSGANNTSTLLNPTHEFSNCGSYNVCLTITSVDGCTNSHCRLVTVIDSLPPIIMDCPIDNTVSTNFGQCFYSGSPYPLVASDNCDPDPTINCIVTDAQGNVTVITPQTQFKKGNRVIQCNAVDKCGNESAPCYFVFEVIDTWKPTINCPSNVIANTTISGHGTCEKVINGLAPTVSDNCPMLVVDFVISGATVDSGTNDASGKTFFSGQSPISMVTYTVTDMAGNTASCSFTLTLTCNGGPPCNCPNGSVPGTNLVDNGDFSNVGGFSSNYTPHSGLLVLFPQQYWLGKNPNLINGEFEPCTDHTTGTENMMVINGATNSNAKVWCQTLAVTPNTTYLFRAWTASLSAGPSAQLQLFINNAPIGTGIQASDSTCNWQQYCESWFADTNTTANICIIDSNTSEDGNDFALDDISFGQCSAAPACVCTPGLLTLTSDGITNQISCDATVTPTIFCVSDSVTISGSFGCINPDGSGCSEVSWHLFGPNGMEVDNGISSSAIHLYFPANVVSEPGIYYVLLTTLCPGMIDSCFCIAGWRIEPCDSICTCGVFDMGIIYDTGVRQKVNCGEVIPLVTNNFEFVGSFQCHGSLSCTPTLIEWQLKGPNLMSNGTLTATPNFVIPPLYPANFTTPGLYILHLWGHCGTDTCPCVVTFCIPPSAPIVADTAVCRTLTSAYIPITGCTDTCGITQVRWFVKPCSATAWPSTPYQVSSGPGCSSLLLLPYQYSNESCVQVYAEITLEGGCCNATQLISNVAWIVLCDPISCSINNANPSYCQSGTPAALQVSYSTPLFCNYTAQWYYQGQPITNATGLSYQPPALTYQQNPVSQCYFDHVYSVTFTGPCGPVTCSTSIRVYNDNAPIGTIEMVPFEDQPFCRGEDATLVYTDSCAGEPAMWNWYISTTSANSGFTPIPNFGTKNSVINTNRLYQTTWYKVSKQNGVCPRDEIVYKIEVKDTLAITNFTAIPDTCVDKQVVLNVYFTPASIAGSGCIYVIDWYKDGDLIHTTTSNTSPASYTYNSPTPNQGSVAGVYYAFVRDNCCRGSVQAGPKVIDPTCVPVVSGPCYVCDKTTPYTLFGDMVLPPQDPCPPGAICTYQWYRLDVGPDPDVWVKVGTPNSLTFDTMGGGRFRFESICDYSYGPCTRNAYHDVTQCESTGTGCMSVDAPEVELPIGIKVKIHPNPTSGTITVQINPKPLHKGRIEIVDVNGRMIFSEFIPEDQTSHTLSLGSLPKGLYFLRVFESDILVWTDKIVRGE